VVVVHPAFDPLQSVGREHQEPGETRRYEPGHSGEVNRGEVSSGSRIATGLSAVGQRPSVP
jgi:hypothetical protein